jgi:ADP-heptose:LPS heptosyltransferase
LQAACLNPLEELPKGERILIIRLGALGDVVRTLPAFAAIRARYPQAHLAWLVERRAESAVRARPGVDEVLVFPREELASALRAWRPLRLLGEASRFAADLRRRRFDLVVDFHAIFKSGLIARLSGAPLRVSYDRPFSREGAWRFANRRARIEPVRVSRFERNAALVDYLGIESPTTRGAGEGAAGGKADSGLLPVDPVLAERFERLRGMRGGRGSVVIHPGSSRATPYKRYPVEYWGEVAKRLAGDGFRCIVSAGPSEAESQLAQAVVEAGAGAAELAPATPTLAELAALYSTCRLFLGSDSGPLHVAPLVGTPVVQLLGPTDPVENHPWVGTPSRSLRVPIACSPCRGGCPAAPCMRVLPVSSVVAAARELLRAGRPEAKLGRAAGAG